MPVEQIVEQAQVTVATPDGPMPAFLCNPAQSGRFPAVLLLMEAFGLTAHIRDVAARLAKEGYVVLAPDLYYRERSNLTFDYDQVAAAMAMMGQLDFGPPIEADLRAAIAYLQSRPDTDRIGVTGFCLGGGLSFLAACRFSAEIAAAAPFYGMVLDEWIEAVQDISVPMLLFFGGQDSFIGDDRVQQIETRFGQLGKDCTVQVYTDANHGFFCHERESYHAAAASHAWQTLMDFFLLHL